MDPERTPICFPANEGTHKRHFKSVQRTKRPFTPSPGANRSHAARTRVRRVYHYAISDYFRRRHTNESLQPTWWICSRKHKQWFSLERIIKRFFVNTRFWPPLMSVFLHQDHLDHRNDLMLPQSVHLVLTRLERIHFQKVNSEMNRCILKCWPLNQVSRHTFKNMKSILRWSHRAHFHENQRQNEHVGPTSRFRSSGGVDGAPSSVEPFCNWLVTVWPRPPRLAHTLHSLKCGKNVFKQKNKKNKKIHCA